MQIIKTSKANYEEKLSKAMKPFIIKENTKNTFILGNVNLPSALIDDNTLLGVLFLCFSLVIGSF